MNMMPYISALAKREMGEIDKLIVEQTIPIYTRKNPHPVKLKGDCPIETLYKQGLRQSMLRELNSGGDK